MAAIPLLNPAEEDALHKERLLNYEEKPFRRLTLRLLGPQSKIVSSTGTPNKSDEDEKAEEDDTQRSQNLKLFEEDVLLDFANFESSLIRMQLLLNSNMLERERYAEEKDRILNSAKEVKENTSVLRSQLDDAQKLLALRKTYDTLTEKITGNRNLKPREEQLANIEKLNTEIAELERESKEYAETWVERRDQFDRIIQEGMQLRRLIRDEKEEVERREGMEGREEAEDAETGSARGRTSAMATPRPEAGGATPLHPGLDSESGNFLSDKHLHPRGTTPLRFSAMGTDIATPDPIREEDDEDMIEDGELQSGDENGSENGRSERGEEDMQDAERQGSAEAMDTT